MESVGLCDGCDHCSQGSVDSIEKGVSAAQEDVTSIAQQDLKLLLELGWDLVLAGCGRRWCRGFSPRKEQKRSAAHSDDDILDNQVLVEIFASVIGVFAIFVIIDKDGWQYEAKDAAYGQG